MMVIWASTKVEAEEWRRSKVLGRGGVVTAGNSSARTLDGLRPTSIVMLPGAGEGKDGQQVREVLNRCTQRAAREVPWLDLRVSQ